MSLYCSYMTHLGRLSRSYKMVHVRLDRGLSSIVFMFLYYFVSVTLVFEINLLEKVGDSLIYIILFPPPFYILILFHFFFSIFFPFFPFITYFFFF
jgi:hypothetical protein